MAKKIGGGGELPEIDGKKFPERKKNARKIDNDLSNNSPDKAGKDKQKKTSETKKWVIDQAAIKKAGIIDKAQADKDLEKDQDLTGATKVEAEQIDAERDKVVVGGEKEIDQIVNDAEAEKENDYEFPGQKTIKLKLGSADTYQVLENKAQEYHAKVMNYSPYNVPDAEISKNFYKAELLKDLLATGEVNVTDFAKKIMADSHGQINEEALLKAVEVVSDYAENGGANVPEDDSKIDQALIEEAILNKKKEEGQEKTWFVQEIKLVKEDTPFGRALVKVLGDKLAEYEERLGKQMDEGDSGAYDSFYKGEILKKILAEGQVNIAELAKEIEGSQGGLDEEKFNKACEVIDDYVNNKGFGANGAFKYDLMKAKAEEREKENNPGTEPEVEKENTEPVVEPAEPTEEDFFKQKWEALSLGQQEFVQDGLTQFYLDEAKEKAREQFDQETSKGSGNSWRSRNWKKLTRGVRVASMEKDYLQKVSINPEDNIAYTEHLINIAQRMGQGMEEKEGKVFIDYNNIKDLSPENSQLFANFNTFANNFGSLPQEWAFDSASKENREAFQGEKRAYEVQRRNLLNALVAEKGRTEALDVVNNIDAQVALRQFIINNPEASKEFAKMKDSSPWKRLFGTVIAERGMMTAAGASSRGALKLATFLGAVGAGVSVVALPVIAGTVGAWRGWARTDKKFKEGDIKGRHLENDPQSGAARKEALRELQAMVPAKFSADPEEWLADPTTTDEQRTAYFEKKALVDLHNKNLEAREGIKRGKDGEIKKVNRLEANISSADDLSNKLINVLNRLGDMKPDSFSDFNEYMAEYQKVRASLTARIDFSQRKLDDGLVSFGSGEERTAKFLSFQQALARAEVYAQYSQETDNINWRASHFLNYLKGETTSQRRTKKVEAAVTGAVISTAFFFAGAAARKGIHHLYENAVDYFSGGYNHDVSTDVLATGAVGKAFPGSHLNDTIPAQPASGASAVENVNTSNPAVNQEDVANNNSGTKTVEEAKETVKKTNTAPKIKHTTPKIKVGGKPSANDLPKHVEAGAGKGTDLPEKIDANNNDVNDLPGRTTPENLDDELTKEIKKIPGMDGRTPTIPNNPFGRPPVEPQGTMVGVPEDHSFDLPGKTTPEGLSTDFDEDAGRIPSLDGQNDNITVPNNADLTPKVVAGSDGLGAQHETVAGNLNNRVSNIPSMDGRTGGLPFGTPGEDVDIPANVNADVLPQGTMVGVPEAEDFGDLPSGTSVDDLNQNLNDELGKIPGLDGRNANIGVINNADLTPKVGATPAGGPKIQHETITRGLNNRVNNIPSMDGKTRAGLPFMAGTANEDVDLPENVNAGFNPDEATPVELGKGTSVFENAPTIASADDLPAETGVDDLSQNLNDELGKIPALDGQNANIGVINNADLAPKVETVPAGGLGIKHETVVGNLNNRASNIIGMEGKMRAGLPFAAETGEENVDLPENVNAGFNPDEATPINLGKGTSVFENAPTIVSADDLPASGEIDPLDNLNSANELSNIPANDSAGAVKAITENLNTSTGFNPDEATPVNLGKGTSVFENAQQTVVSPDDLPASGEVNSPGNLNSVDDLPASTNANPLEDLNNNLPNIPANDGSEALTPDLPDSVTSSSNIPAGFNPDQATPIDLDHSASVFNNLNDDYHPEDDFAAESQNLSEAAKAIETNTGNLPQHVAEIVNFNDLSKNVAATNVGGTIVDGIYNGKRGFVSLDAFLKKFEELNKGFKLSDQDKLSARAIWEEVQRDRATNSVGRHRIVNAMAANLEKVIMYRAEKG